MPDGYGGVIYLQGRTFAPDIDTAAEKIFDKLAVQGLTGAPKIWLAPVQPGPDIWFEYCCLCGEE